MLRKGSLFFATLLCILPVRLIHAEVADSAPGGFTVKHELQLSASAEAVYRAIVKDVGLWWDPAHTFSQNSGNLYIEARPNGCFCERLGKEAGVRHLEVVFAQPGKRLRLSGGLGPLQAMALTGSMDWELTTSGNGTRLDFYYRVGGYYPAGLDKLAPAVDGVLNGQLQRLKGYIEKGTGSAK